MLPPTQGQGDKASYFPRLDTEGMVTQLGAPATETPLSVPRQIKRAMAAILISSGSETGLSGAEQDVLLDRVERGNVAAENRRSPTFRAAVTRATTVDREVLTLRSPSGTRTWPRFYKPPRKLLPARSKSRA